MVAMNLAGTNKNRKRKENGFPLLQIETCFIVHLQESLK
jgi:hypothetical protein